MDALEFVGISDMALEPASALSQGDLKRLEVARAIATEPELLLLDEPLGGLNPAESELLAKSIKRLHKGGRFGRLLQRAAGPAGIPEAVHGQAARQLVRRDADRLALPLPGGGREVREEEGEAAGAGAGRDWGARAVDYASGGRAGGFGAFSMPLNLAGASRRSQPRNRSCPHCGQSRPAR